jgi:NAD(P)-dependent dehydrogenase (short-subunit alcohol dehydrogenase family)
VNNAGYGLLGAVEEASAAETGRLFGTNVFGLLSVTRAVLPHMRRQRSGHVINLSSVGGYTGYLGWGVYGATKFAVEGISEALAGEVAPLGIKVTVVEPGFFRTDFLDETSLSRTAREIEDYRDTVGRTRAHAADANHGQRGDPRKLAQAFIALTNAEAPPLRLPLGSDTVERIEAKNALVAKELAEWRTVATSTDFTAN